MDDFKVFIEFVTILLLFYVFGFSAARHVQTQLPDKGLNTHPELRKVKSESLDHQGSPTTF